MQNGKIGVTTENIFPIIKKFLYSEHDIFIRELVSNAVDATQKLKTLSSVGEFKGELGTPRVDVAVNPEAKTITISDNGIGMTADEVERYINQIAFSGAEEFLEKYKDSANIIGHFGLGFYSSFMVASKVELSTLSYREGAKAVCWSCDGSPEYTMKEIEKKSRGTEIVLHLAEDSQEFASKEKIGELLNKYCRFLPVEVVFGKRQEWKDGNHVDTDEDNVINDTNPLWTRRPADLKEEDYAQFYRMLYPMAEEPLFHIHLNVDYPFNLTGVLYFPKVKNNFEIQKNKIQLYCNQVFVTDSVEGIVPEFLTLLHGVIDSPDIPLNVSRSYLQGDPNVKKISAHITKKVADRLQEIFSSSREEFESKWDDLKIFIQYGMVTEEKFAEKAASFVLFKNTEGKYFTLDEYKKHIEENQTDKNKNIILLYTTNTEEQFGFIEAARAKGYDVLLMNGQLDAHFISWYEGKNQNCHFTRVDADVIDKLIAKDVKHTMALNSEQQDILRPVFESHLPANDKTMFNVSFEPLDENDVPVLITRNEFARRMKDMSQMGGSPYAFYGDMPDNFNVVINGNHPLVTNVLEETEKSVGSEIKSANAKIETLRKEKDNFQNVIKDKKEDDLTSEERSFRDEIEKKLSKATEDKRNKLFEVGRNTKLVSQLIDLALLGNGMLKGESLNKFIKRSIDLM